MKLTAPENPPHIDSLAVAVAFGQAMGDVLHWDRGWCERIYQSDPALNWYAGPNAVNNEIKSMWRSYWTNEQKLKLIAAFTMYRLAR